MRTIAWLSLASVAHAGLELKARAQAQYVASPSVLPVFEQQVPNTGIQMEHEGPVGFADGVEEIDGGAREPLQGIHQPGSCDVTATGPVCFSERRYALEPGAQQGGLVGHWTFDEQAALDSSGHGNHGATELMHGPAPAGSGHSGLFRKNFMMVPNSPTIQHLGDFTYSFWVFVEDNSDRIDDDTPRWCPMIRKGVFLSEEVTNSPALLFSRRTGHLRASVSTTHINRGDGEFVDSNARLVYNRWAHVALVLHTGTQNRMLIYVNGILDAKLTTQGAVMQNEYPLYVGGDPFTADSCKDSIYMDELRLYNRAVAPHELQAEAAPALGGADPSYVRLGCLSCTLQEAVHMCPATRHICAALELHTGGYQVARALGWLVAGTHVWTHAAVEQFHSTGDASMSGSPSTGLGLCCDGPSP